MPEHFISTNLELIVEENRKRYKVRIAKENIEELRDLLNDYLEYGKTKC